MRKLQEEEEASMSSSNAIKKLANEVKLRKEDVENMDFRYHIVLKISQNVSFEFLQFWYFSTNVLLKLTCLVTLVKFQV